MHVFPFLHRVSNIFVLLVVPSVLEWFTLYLYLTKYTHYSVFTFFCTVIRQHILTPLPEADESSKTASSTLYFPVSTSPAIRSSRAVSLEPRSSSLAVNEGQIKAPVAVSSGSGSRQRTYSSSTSSLMPTSSTSTRFYSNTNLPSSQRKWISSVNSTGSMHRRYSTSSSGSFGTSSR